MGKKSEFRSAITDLIHANERTKEGLIALLEMVDVGVESDELRTLRANYSDVVKRLEDA